MLNAVLFCQFIFVNIEEARHALLLSYISVHRFLVASKISALHLILKLSVGFFHYVLDMEMCISDSK